MSGWCCPCGKINAASVRLCEDCGQRVQAATAHGGVAAASAGRIDRSGERLAGRFRLIKRLGQGGMGEVYLAEDERLGRRLAVKMLAPELLGSREAWQRMWQEGQTLARIDDVNVVKVFDLFEEDGQGTGSSLAMVMELVPGGDLRGRLAEGAIPWQEACAIVSGVLSGLAAIHQVGLVHRDIKPENILVSANGTPKVTDLGVAREMSGRMQTQAGLAIGTSEYMSPEQVRGEVVDERTDVYAVGLLLYELIVGRGPYADLPDYELPVAQVKQVVDLAPVAAAGAGQLIEVMRRALSKTKEARPAGAEEMRRALVGAMSGAPYTASYAAPPLELATVSRPAPVPARPSVGGMPLPLASSAHGALKAYRLEPQGASWSKERLFIAVSLFVSVVCVVFVLLRSTEMFSVTPIEFVAIEGGTMEYTTYRRRGRPRVQTVNVADFSISKSEVTVGQYRECVEAGGCTTHGLEETLNCNWTKSGVEDHPINCVSWRQATAFTEWAKVRLPTEFEWYYAATSEGLDQAYPWGDEAASCERVVMDDGGDGCGENGTWPVCSKPAGHSAQGLCDLEGSVSEWTAIYTSSAQRSREKQMIIAGGRTARGGSWADRVDGTPIGRHSMGGARAASSQVGFRVCKTKR